MQLSTNTALQWPACASTGLSVAHLVCHTLPSMLIIIGAASKICACAAPLLLIPPHSKSIAHSPVIIWIPFHTPTPTARTHRRIYACGRCGLPNTKTHLSPAARFGCLQLAPVAGGVLASHKQVLAIELASACGLPPYLAFGQPAR